MEIYRLTYTELPKPSKELQAFMAKYFQEHDTGDEGIIAGIDSNTIEDMIDTCGMTDAMAEELRAWWKKVSPYGGCGFDIQILRADVIN